MDGGHAESAMTSAPPATVIGGLEILPELERIAAMDEGVRPPYGTVKDEAADAIVNIRARVDAEENG